MKIVCVSASQIPSDTANSIQVMKVCQALVQLGHAVTLIVPITSDQSSISNQQKLAEHYGLTTEFEIEWLPGHSRRAFPLRAVRRARFLRADLLYVWPLQAAALGLLVGMPVMLEMHDLPSGHIGPLWYRLFLWLRGRKRLLVITYALRNELEKRYGTVRDIIFAPNGVDFERFTDLPSSKTARRKLSLPDNQTVACTGHLYAGRGADLFLELAKTFPQADFLWVGGRPGDVAEWQTRAASLGLRNVTFTGFVPNERLPFYQAAADVLLMPYAKTIAISSGMGHSAQVASPMKMFEYMASGRAILASDLPVLREVLDESMAVFCPPEDLEAWKTALSALLDDSKRRQVLGQRARQAAQGYSWTARASRILEGWEG
jgi:glycosyltransferase involved in cell wall biosynthesis